MKLRSIRHKALRRFIKTDDGRGLRPDLVARTCRIVTAIAVASTVDDLNGPPGWRIHQLVGDRARTWSVSASGNWRITFTVDDGEVFDRDLEADH